MILLRGRRPVVPASRPAGPRQLASQLYQSSLHALQVCDGVSLRSSSEIHDL